MTTEDVCFICILGKGLRKQICSISDTLLQRSLFIYWKDKVTERERGQGRGREREGARSPVFWFVLQIATMARAWARLKLGARNFIQVSKVSIRTCVSFCCLPRHIVKKLDQQWSSWVSNGRLYAMAALEVVA